MSKLPAGPRVDAVIVAYNSARTLRGCVKPLAAMADVNITVVDNDSTDRSLASIADLPVTAIAAGRNGGFAAGCNLGISQGSAPYVLLLNPDARIAAADVDELAKMLDADLGVGIVAPRILEPDGSLSWSLRRFPRRRSTFAQALFLHRLWPRASWTDELVRDPRAYEQSGSHEWVSGACMLIRRDLLERIGGLDEDFFLYCEDTDLCARVHFEGFDIRYEPRATVTHEGGASRPRAQLLTVSARSRVLYAQKHAPAVAVPVEALGVALSHVTHALASLTRPAMLRGHIRALGGVLRPSLPSTDAR